MIAIAAVIACLAASPALALGIPTLPSISCPVGSVQVPLMPGLEIPPGEKTSLVTLGRGVQNYTCTAGKYVSAGAVASLYDVSCPITLGEPFIKPYNLSSALTTAAFTALDSAVRGKLPVKLDHYFTRLATGIAPVFRDPKTKIEVVGTVTTRIAAPQDPATTVPWLRLTAVSGTLAKSVYRTHTVGGQPPVSCTEEGSGLSVEYAAMYYFTK